VRPLPGLEATRIQHGGRRDAEEDAIRVGDVSPGIRTPHGLTKSADFEDRYFDRGNLAG
jgi:hypothetical protein